jgi:hypothetical protein
MSELLPASPRRRIDGEAASRRRARREAVGLPQPPWRHLVNPYEPIEVLTAEARASTTPPCASETHGLEFRMTPPRHPGRAGAVSIVAHAAFV